MANLHVNQCKLGFATIVQKSLTVYALLSRTEINRFAIGFVIVRSTLVRMNSYYIAQANKTIFTSVFLTVNTCGQHCQNISDTITQKLSNIVISCLCSWVRDTTLSFEKNVTLRKINHQPAAHPCVVGPKAVRVQASPKRTQRKRLCAGLPPGNQKVLV